MGKGRTVTGKSVGKPISEEHAKELYDQKRKVKIPLLQKKFNDDKAHYQEVLMGIVRKTIDKGMPHKNDEQALVKIFDDGNKEWIKIVQKVNASSKVLKLGAQQFRYEISLLAARTNNPDATKVESSIPEVKENGEENK